MKRSIWKSFVIVVIAAIVLAGCSGGGSEVGGAVTEKGNDRVLTVAVGTDLVTFDIHDHNNTSTEAIHVNMFNYLFKKIKMAIFIQSLPRATRKSMT